MTTITIWQKANKIQVVQLSDDPTDGSDAEQIAHLKTLDAYAGWTCVSEKYTGTFPNTDSSLWMWSNGQVTTSQPPIATVVTMRQARLALLQFGVLATVNTNIALGSETDRIKWEYATEVRRTDPLVTNMATALGLNASQLDALFALASTL